MTETPKYGIILADPPWAYNARNNAGTKFSKGVHGHYPTMATAEICKIPVADITDNNCVLIMWVTFPKLSDGLAVMKSWGFRYVTVAFNWFKTNADESPFFGVGYYTKSNTEIALLGIKGKVKPVSNFISQVIVSRRESHSKKPDIARTKIVELFGDLPRAELFARERHDGWACIGNEVDGLDITASISRLRGDAFGARSQ